MAALHERVRSHLEAAAARFDWVARTNPVPRILKDLEEGRDREAIRAITRTVTLQGAFLSAAPQCIRDMIEVGLAGKASKEMFAAAPAATGGL